MPEESILLNTLFHPLSLLLVNFSNLIVGTISSNLTETSAVDKLTKAE